MNLIVIGGAGFIGTNFCKLVKSVKPDWKILILDKLTYASVKSNYPHEFEIIHFDICNTSNMYTLENVLTEVINEGKEKPIIINFAAETHVDNSIDNASTFIKTNIEGVFNILELSKRLDIRLIHISTDEVMGDLPINSSNKFNINSPLSPNNPYAATKAAAENLINSYINTYGIRANITRCTNNYGPWQHKEKLIPKTIVNLLNGNKATIYGTGNNIRDWIHVDDHCEGIIKVIEHGINGKTYMFGGNNELSNNDLVKQICKELELDESYISYIEDRKGHDRRYAIKKHTPGFTWTPKKSFNNCLKETIQWYKDNQHF